MSDIRPVRIAAVGTGPIGRMHAKLVAASPNAVLAGISSLDNDAADFAESVAAPLRADYRHLIDGGIDGVVIATPNQLHLEMGTFFAERGVHVLVEKPIADTVGAGKALCGVAKRHGVHVLVGQHRRYNNLVKIAAQLVRSELGTPIATNSVVAMKKPDSYYDVAWRRSASAGPLLVNLIHDVDLLRATFGEIDYVQAVSSKRVRAFDFDDTAAIVLRYASGALGTMILSDSTPSPWCWEATVDEGLAPPNMTGLDHVSFMGATASLSFPSMTLWHYDPADGEPGWRQPLHSRQVPVERNSPYSDQIEHFVEVIRGTQAPAVSGINGLRSLAVVTAIIEAARSGCGVDITELIERS